MGNTNQLIGTPFCDKLCTVHNCVREKGLKTGGDNDTDMENLST